MDKEKDELEYLNSERFAKILEEAFEEAKRNLGNYTDSGFEQEFKDRFREGFKEGFQNGKEEVEIESSIKLLKAGKDIDFVVEVTGLSIDKVKELKSKL